MPDWIYEEPEFARNRRRKLSPTSWAADAAGKALARMFDIVAGKDWAELERELPGLEAEGLAPGYVAYARAKVLSYRGRLNEAIEELRRTRQLEPDFYFACRGVIGPFGRWLVRHLTTSTPENRALLGRWIQRARAGYRRDALLEDPFDAATRAGLEQKLRERLRL